MVKSGIFLTTTLAEEELWAAPFALGSVAKSLVEKTILTLQTEPQMQRSVISVFDGLLGSSRLINKGHLAALTRCHLIGDHPSGLTKEQTTETMDPSPKTKGLRPYSHQ